MIVKFQFFLLILLVVIPLAAGLLTPQQEGSLGRGVSIRDGLHCFCQQAKHLHSCHSLSGSRGCAGGFWVGKDPIRASATGDRDLYFSCNSLISAVVQLLLGQEHLLAKWHNQEHLGIAVCLFLPSPLSAKC